MKIIIIFFLAITLVGCSTVAKTHVQRDSVTGKELYSDPVEKLIYADVEGKGWGKVSKTIKVDPTTGKIIEYSVTVDPSYGAQSAAKNLADFGGSIAGAATRMFNVIIPVE